MNPNLINVLKEMGIKINDNCVINDDTRFAVLWCVKLGRWEIRRSKLTYKIHLYAPTCEGPKNVQEEEAIKIWNEYVAKIELLDNIIEKL